MIVFVIGTTGELIKIAPVLRRLREVRHPYRLVTTAQQVTQIEPFLAQFGVPGPDLWLARGAGGRDLATNADIPVWLATVGRTFFRHHARLRRILRADTDEPTIVVHGDTMSTVLGALMGRALGARVAHIEAGLRSYSLRDPFPEELNRRLTSRIASMHFAPGPWAAANLSRGVVVDTGRNTICDSLAMVPDSLPVPIEVPEEPFGIVSLHRYELLRSRALLTETIRVLEGAARRTPMLFVDHAVTAAALRRFGLERAFDDTRLIRVPRLRFFEFVQLERRCLFAVTDSGGSQEECYYLDRPCLIHRRRTERREGLGETSILSGLDPRVLGKFLENPSVHRRRTQLPAASPTEIIVEHLRRASDCLSRGGG